MPDFDTDSFIVNYSHEPQKDSFHILPFGLLEQKGVKIQDIKTGEYNGIVTIFSSETGDMPFDIFSAVFYMVSRYEEYLPFVPDQHGRFRAEDGIAYKHKFHNIPIVDLWVKKLSELIEIPFPYDNYKFQLTIDVDCPWKYKGQSLFRTFLRMGKMLSTGHFKDFSEAFAVLSGRKPDPWFTFDYLDTIEKQLKNPIQYFILFGQKRPHDTAPSIHKKDFKKLVNRLGTKQKIGIHPSYASYASVKELEKEYYSMSYIIKNKIQRSRQHYLKMKFPETFRNLIRLGIRQEFSMGWVSQVGFRAGIARSFPFYDLEKEKETHLILVPFFAMDRSMKDYMNIDRTKAREELMILVNRVKEVSGQFCMLWHNDSISDAGEWKGWREIFEEMVKYAEPD